MPVTVIFLVLIINSTLFFTMNQNNPLVVNLRQQLQEVKDELAQYKGMYRNERRDRRQQEERCQMLQQQVLDVGNEKNLYRDKLYQCREHINSFKVPKPLKRWSSLRSPISRAKRKSQYRKCLDQSMMHLHEASRVRLQMRVGNEEIVIIWSQDDLRNFRAAARIVVRPHVQIPGNVANANAQLPNQRIESEDDDTIDESEDYPDAFLTNGSWNPVHLKRIVHVMDIFKISQLAYHELRMTSRSILPPINRILKIKANMSEAIQPLHHRTVRFLTDGPKPFAIFHIL